MTPEKKIEVANYLRERYDLPVKPDEPDDDMILTLLCFIIGRVAPAVTRAADDAIGDRIENLMIELQERNREDLGELAGLKTKQADELRAEFTAQARRTQDAIDRLCEAIKESGIAKP